MGNLESKKQKWREIKQKNEAPPRYAKWTDKDEAKLLQLLNTDVEIKDTVLGRMKAQRTAEFEAAFTTMSKEKQQEFLNKLQKKHYESA